MGGKAAHEEGLKKINQQLNDFLSDTCLTHADRPNKSEQNFSEFLITLLTNEPQHPFLLLFGVGLVRCSQILDYV